MQRMEVLTGGGRGRCTCQWACVVVMLTQFQSSNWCMQIFPFTEWRIVQCLHEFRWIHAHCNVSYCCVQHSNEAFSYANRPCCIGTPTWWISRVERKVGKHVSICEMWACQQTCLLSFTHWTGMLTNQTQSSWHMIQSMITRGQVLKP